MNNRQSDGWLGTCFHSRMRGAKHLDVSEAAIKFLSEKGVSLEHEVFANAANAYLTRSKNDPIYDGFEKYYDEYDFSSWGLWLIRSSGLARMGKEKCIDLTKEIDDVLNYNNIREALSAAKNGTLYFKNGVLWPCRYHLEILAFTQCWRNEDNIKKLAKAIDHLFTFPETNEPIYTKISNHYISPCDAFVQRPIEHFEQNSVSGNWFCKMELFVRCGIIPYSNYLSREVETLKQSIDANGICHANIDEKFFKSWGAYSGLKIEENWRTEIRKKCDVTFRAFLILKYGLGGK